MNVNAKPLSELSRLEACLIAASTPFKSAPQQLITSGKGVSLVPTYSRPALLKFIVIQTICWLALRQPLLFLACLP